ncbi:MAG: hypothetical protein LQ348_001091 [Seirophora lacunosa]|nr:MAG: hypothetical protein LQ344_001488 [Seirophora lacunosa]KAI4206091.1 MAG: hypothetical protein LQ348_001091 [Seirophora lacunosa]
MEGDEQQRRQYEHQQYASGYPQTFRSSVRESHVSERLGHAQLMTGRSPSSASVGSITGAHGQDMGNYGYPQGHQYPPSQVQYPTDYHQDLQRSQNFPQYTSQMAYNVPQQSHPRSPYDAMPQYQPRQSAAIDALPSQFGVHQYYQGGESMSASAQASPAQHYAPSHFQQPLRYQATGIGHSTAPLAYSTAMAEYPQSGTHDVAEQVAPGRSSHEEGYNRYEERLRQVFEKTSKGQLAEAAQALLDNSEWLLVNVKDLGLVTDIQLPRQERLKLWSEFNTGWLAVLQCQKDETQRMIDTGQPPVPPGNVLQGAVLERMGEALVSFCDGVEKYGLVDYQMGVWEEEIMSILTQCLDLQDTYGAHASEVDNRASEIQ